MAISALVSLALQVPDWIFIADQAHVPEIERRADDLSEYLSASADSAGAFGHFPGVDGPFHETAVFSGRDLDHTPRVHWGQVSIEPATGEPGHLV